MLGRPAQKVMLGNPGHQVLQVLKVKSEPKGKRGMQGRQVLRERREPQVLLGQQGRKVKKVTKATKVTREIQAPQALMHQQIPTFRKRAARGRFQATRPWRA